MIKLTVGELVNSTEVLQKLAGMELKAKLAFQVSRLLKSADKEIQVFNEARMNLVKKNGEKDENGELKTDEQGNCKIPPEFIETFSKELTELLTTEVEINANKLKIDEFGDLEFTPAEMAQLDPFIDFGEETAE